MGPMRVCSWLCCKLRKTGSWEAAWGTIRTILQEDPIEPVETQIDVAIDYEADRDLVKALEWSKERYSLLLDRSQTEKLGLPPVSSSSVLSAGSELVHLCYLAGEMGQAAKVLDEMNSFVTIPPGRSKGLGR